MNSREQFSFSTQWGTASISFDDSGTPVAVDPPTDRRTGIDAPPQPATIPPPEVRDLAARMVRWFAGEPVELATEAELGRWLDAAGVAGFRRSASLALARVPRGLTLTYGELAEQAGAPRAARAAGSTCSNNPLPIVIPCHRVLPAQGGIGAYGFHGPAYKQRLLELEQGEAARNM